MTYPKAAPPIDVATIDARPAPAPLAPAPLAPAPPAPAPVAPPLPPLVAPNAPIYPKTAPSIDIASLDVRPALPATPAAKPSPPAVEAAAPASPTSDVCRPTDAQLAAYATVGRLTRTPRQPRVAASDPTAFGIAVANAAKAQTKDLVIYSARYQPMAYPMGDVVSLYGACTDVIIRAYRAVGIDLQEQVQRTRSGRGDPNIDHRRTETLRSFFTRQGASLPVTAFPEDYKPGDIVTYYRPFSRVSNAHIAVVSDVLAPSGRPMIVHNRGYGPQLEDALFVDRITGHYRYLGPPAEREPDTASIADPAASASARGRSIVRASFPATFGPRPAPEAKSARPAAVAGTSPHPKAGDDKTRE